MQKVVNQALDILQSVLPFRESVAVVGTAPAPFRHALGCLAHDTQALTQFPETHQVAGKAVSPFGSNGVEIKLLVPSIRHGFAQIPSDPGGAQVGSAKAEFDGLLPTDGTDPFCTGAKNRAIGQQTVKLIDARLEVPGENVNGRTPTFGQVVRHATNSEPCGMHAPAGHHLDDIEDLFATVESVEYRRHGTNVMGEGAQPYQVAGDAEQFAE